MLREYVPVLFLFASSLATGVMMAMMSLRIGPRRPTLVKAESYESGMPPWGDTRERFAVKYYVVALLPGVPAALGRRPHLRVEEGRAGVGMSVIQRRVAKASPCEVDGS